MQSLSAHQLQANPVAALQVWLQQLAVPVCHTTIKQTTENHPDYPSLLSLSEALDEWQVDHAALHLDSVDQLRELPTPFLAYHTGQGGYYILVQTVANDTISFIEPASGNRQTETLAAFNRHWSGGVLLAEKTDQSGEPNYLDNRRQERINLLRWPTALAALGSILLLMFIGMAPTLTIGHGLWLITKSLGLLVSIALVLNQLGHTNPLTDRLCHTLSKTGCESILQSPAATLFGRIHWTDIGLIYFTGGLLASLLAGFWPGMLPLIRWLALLAMPYTVFSLYYQAWVARQWCALCLGVQAVLLAEGVLALNQSLFVPTAFVVYGNVAGAFLLPAALWLMGKPLWQQAQETDSLRRQLNRFKNKPELFTALLNRQPKAPIWRPDALIRLGNPNAEHVLTVVTNPYCGPCATMHRAIETLLDKRQNLRAEIIFLACDGPTGRTTTVLRHLLALTNPGSITLALSAWYDQDAKAYTDWAQNWPADAEQTSLEAVQQHCDWCREAAIEATPTVFVNGYKLPEQYRLEDIRWVISESINFELVSIE